MASPALFRRHEPASHTGYQDLKQLALSQQRILPGSPGTLKHRTQRGNRYWVRQHARVDGRKADEYLGAEASLDASRIEALQAELDLAKALARGSAKLRLFGYQRIERKAAAVLGVFFNHRLYDAGLTLVGSHAYGALLNDLGIMAPQYRTQDLDLARADRLSVAHADGPVFQEMLGESGLRFVPVPGLPSHRPSASFKLPGAETLAVDLLVPGARSGDVVALAELGAHAQTVPFLRFLVEEAVIGVVLSPNHVIPVKLPAPERFALHKLYSSQSRRTQRDKARKDLEQAAVIAAALEEITPGAIQDAFKRLPAAARPATRRGARAALKLLAAYPAAQEELRRLAG